MRGRRVHRNAFTQQSFRSQWVLGFLVLFGFGCVSWLSWCNSACISLRGRALTSVVAAIESLGWWAAASPAATTLRPPPAAARWARPHLELPAHLGNSCNHLRPHLPHFGQQRILRNLPRSIQSKKASFQVVHGSQDGKISITRNATAV